MAVLYIQSVIAGLLISLAGSLPLGNLNVAAMQIAIKETLSKALWFSLGVIIIEITYLAITISIIGRYAIGDGVLLYFKLLSIAIMIVLAIGSFRAAGHKNGKNIILQSRTKRFYLGIAMSALNPMQIPFWTGWIIYLISGSLIADTPAGFILFALSAGLGTFIALLVFIFSGHRFSEIMMRKEKQVNFIIGCLFVVMAMCQLFKLWQR